MAIHVFPTENDVGASTGAGRVVTEINWTKLFAPPTSNDNGQSFGGMNWVKNGFDYASASGLVATFNVGTAVIDGYFIESTSTLDVTLPVSSNRVLVYLKLTVDGSTKIDGAELEYQTGTTVPARSVLLYEVDTNGSTVTTARPRFGVTSDSAGTSNSLYSYYHGSGSTPQTVMTGFQPRMVSIADTVSSDRMISINGLGTVVDDFGTVNVLYITGGFQCNSAGLVVSARQFRFVAFI